MNKAKQRLREAEVVAKTKEKQKRGERSRQWQLTENNPEYTKQQAVERLASIGSCVYAIGCSETGESGTKHVHVYAVWENAIELGSLKKLFPRAHFEHCKGSAQSNVEYISKSDLEPYEVGTKPLMLGERKADISAEVVALILEGGLSPIEILRNYTQYSQYVVKHFKSLNDIYQASKYQ